MQFMLYKLSIIIVEYKMNALKRLNNFTGYSFRIKNAIETTATTTATTTKSQLSNRDKIEHYRDKKKNKNLSTEILVLHNQKKNLQ